MNILPVELKLHLIQVLHLKDMLTLSKVSVDLYNVVYVDKLYTAYKKLRNEIDKICRDADNHNFNLLFDIRCYASKSLKAKYNDPYRCFELSIHTSNLIMAIYLYEEIISNAKHNSKIIFLSKYESLIEIMLPNTMDALFLYSCTENNIDVAMWLYDLWKKDTMNLMILQESYDKCVELNHYALLKKFEKRGIDRIVILKRMIFYLETY